MRKNQNFLLLLFLVMSFLRLNGQTLNHRSLLFDEAYIKAQSLEIMKILNIPIRKYILRDDPITYSVDFRLGGLSALFSSEKIGFYNKDNGEMDTSSIIHVKPYIKFAPQLDSVIKSLIKINWSDSIRVIGNVLHEMTHYHQVSYSDNDSLFQKVSLSFDPGSKEYRKYVEQPTEIEACAAMSYFQLFFVNKPLLNKIMKMNINNTKRWKILTNEANKWEYPWRKAIFPELNLKYKK